jgi:hypothetical protein
MPSSHLDSRAADAGARAQAAARALVVQRLIEQTIALSAATTQPTNRAYAHRLACDIRDLAWSVGLPGPGATAAVLAQRFSDRWVTQEDLWVALEAVFTEVHRAAGRTGGNEW